MSMAYFSDHNELGYFGCGSGCSCKSCRAVTQNLSQVYEEEEPPQPAPATPKMAGWLGAYPAPAARFKVVWVPRARLGIWSSND